MITRVANLWMQECLAKRKSFWKNIIFKKRWVRNVLQMNLCMLPFRWDKNDKECTKAYLTPYQRLQYCHLNLKYINNIQLSTLYDNDFQKIIMKLTKEIKVSFIVCFINYVKMYLSKKSFHYRHISYAMMNLFIGVY